MFVIYTLPSSLSSSCAKSPESETEAAKRLVQSRVFQTVRRASPGGAGDLKDGHRGRSEGKRQVHVGALKATFSVVWAVDLVRLSTYSSQRQPRY